MSYSIEQEIKAMLTASEFERVLNYFNLAFDQYHSQQNHYYDTANQDLKNTQAALRLRNFSGASEWTFKQKQDQHRSLELTQSQNYPVVPAPVSITLNFLSDPVIKDQLGYLLDEKTNLNLFLKIKTDRYLIHNEAGEWAIDRTYYGDTVDYELELETDDLAKGQAAFQQLLMDLDLPYRPADKKIARAIRYLQQSNEG